MIKNKNGFTLIELIVVIVILGILAVTAAPKFIDLQSDARIATVKQLKGSLVSAINLVHMKATVAGVKRGFICLNGNNVDSCADNMKIEVDNGFPLVISNSDRVKNLKNMFQDFDDNFQVSCPGEWAYIYLKNDTMPTDFTYVSSRSKYIDSPNACGVFYRYVLVNGETFPTVYEATDGC